MVKSAVLLAAGNSKRFEGNKLLCEIEGKTLPERAIEFCIMNGIQKVYVTIKNEGFYIEHDHTLKHPIMSRLQERYGHKINLYFRFQPDDMYGPAAAILPWRLEIFEPFVVLSGDNFYYGKTDFHLGEHDCVVTYQEREKNQANLRLAAIVDGIVIEKPHAIVQGKYFCGYVIFKDTVLDYVNKIDKSTRGEYEITNLINSMQKVGFIKVPVKWADLTYPGDEEYVKEIIIENGLN